MRMLSGTSVGMRIVFMTMTLTFRDGDCAKLDVSGLQVAAEAAAEVPNTEYFTIHQETQISRTKRDDVNHVDFPLIMHYTFRFKTKQMNVRLRRSEYLRSNIQLSDGNGPIQHDLGRKTGIYTNFEDRASFVIKCEDHMVHCVLQGSIEKDGHLWDITPELPTPALHKATQRVTDVNINLGNVAVHVPKDSVTPDDVQQEYLDMLHKRSRRAIPTNCEIVECYAIADETVWDFHLAYAANDVATAEVNILANYLALYAQADLHFDFVSFRRPGSCIRLYLTGVTIQKTTAESWSFPNEIALPGAVLAFVNTVPSIVTCGAQGNALRNATTSIDLIQCFTRKDIVYDPDNTGTFFASYRSLGFLGTACDPDYLLYSASVIEHYGDKVERLLATEIAYGLNANNDGIVGCADSDQYIMAEQLAIPADPLNIRNLWYFSTCSLDDMYIYINSQPQCLRDNGFTEDEYDNFANQTLAGILYDWDTQCTYRFGLTSERCDPTGQNRTYFPDMCDFGIYCTNPLAGGLCNGFTRPFDGTACGDFNAYCVKGECFEPDALLGNQCDCNSACVDANTTCSATTSTCVCVDGFYQNASSECLPKVSVGATCPEADACLDPNAFCNTGVCECLSGYYNDSGSCFLLKYAGENCTSSDECFGNNIECSGTPRTCRCPSDRYLEFNGGDCLLNKNLGDSCEPGQCGPDFSFCDSTTNTCKCQEGFYDDDGATAGGNCSAKVALNETCLQTDACADPNAECNATASVCLCLPDYYENGLCEPLKCVGENCTSVDQCRGDNMECSGSPSTCRCPSDRYHDITIGNCVPNKILEDSCEPGQCGPVNSFCDSTTNTCKCQEGFFDDNGATADGNCTAKVGLNETCSQTDACFDPNAECTSLTCSCQVDYFENNGTCELLKYVGENCTSAGQCKGENIECSGSPSTCRCPSDRFQDVTTGNCEPKLVLGDSCESGQCGTNNSYCDTTSTTCLCEDGYYDDNGATSGGNCTTKLALGDACSQSDACSDSNAECSTTCVCITDYYNNGGTCEPLLYVGENCAATSDCKGSNVECSGSPATCRCPSDRYLDVSTGNCLTKLVLGDSCESGQCGTTNSYCDTTSTTCLCEDGYYDDNGATSGGSCTTKHALDAACSQTDACSDVNAECSTTCVCVTDYYNNGGTCEPLLCIGENCATTTDCKGSDVECSGSPATCRCPSDRYLDITTGNCLTKLVLGDSCESGQCGTTNSYCDTTSTTCLCEDGYYDDNGATSGGSCSTKLSLNAACSQSDACSDVNAECSTTCVCVTGYYNNGGTCEPLLCIGERCSATSDCKGSDVECSGWPTICQCPSGRYLDVLTGNCLTKLVLGDSCESGQCGTTNSFCDTTSGTCLCEDGYYDDNGATSGGSCTTKLALDVACSQSDACSDVNAECSTTCVCVTDYYNNGGTCEPLLCVGESCAATTNCKGSDVECSGSPATCRCPSDRYLDITTGNCLTKLVLGDSCESGQCGTTNSYCDTTSTTCLCEDGYYDDNGATSGGSCSTKLALDVACSQSDACSDVNAECSTTCVCVTDYYNNGGTCEPLVCVGESCAATSDCKGSNVECSGTPATCRCPSDRYLDVSTGNCLTKLVLGDSCESGQCGTTNSYCDTTSTTCLCEDGYYDDNGATSGGSCSTKLALDAACTQTDACSDVNAECSTTCVCVTDYYNNGGTCDPLLCIGESCAATSDCKGSNTECSGSPATCRCPSDRYIDVSTGNCLTKLAIGETCEPGQCAASNSVCQTSTATCECLSGYTYDQTNCIICPSSDWEAFDGSCYLFGTDEIKYEASRTYCDTFDSTDDSNLVQVDTTDELIEGSTQMLDGALMSRSTYCDTFDSTDNSNLVQVDTTDELTFLKDFMTARATQPTNGYWNDLYEETTNGNEVWRTSGDALTVSDWNRNQPFDENGIQKCTLFFKNFSYRQMDTGCGGRTAFALCEITPS